MKFGNLKIFIFLNSIFFGCIFPTFSADKIETVPLINLEELSPTFEEDKEILEKIEDQNTNINNTENALMKIVHQYSLKAIQHTNIGGRFSVLSSTGLLPAAIMGLDLYSLRNAARRSLSNIFDNNALSESVF